MREAEMGKKVIEILESLPGIKISALEAQPISLTHKIDLSLDVNKGNKDIRMDFEFKKYVFDDHGLKHIINEKKLFNKNDDALFVLAALFISTPMRRKLRDLGISYIDCSGNVYFNYGDVLIFIDGFPNKYVQKRNEALYSEKGLKVVDVLLRDEFNGKSWKVDDLIDKTGVSYGKAFNVTQDLIKKGWGEKQKRGEFRLIKPKLLIEALEEHGISVFDRKESE